MRLICAKIDYLRNQNLNADANALIRENIIYPDFREIVINEAIKKKDFEKAIKLCLEGIEISEKADHYGITDRWRQKLLQISELKKNIPDIRKWSELLFFKSNFDMKYYRKVKSAYDINEWESECERIVEKIKKEKIFGRYGYANTLAEIFIEEKYPGKIVRANSQ